MQYEILSLEEKRTGLMNRLRDLEVEHFSNSVYIREAEVIGDEDSITKFSVQNRGLDMRYDELKRQLEEVEEQIKANAEPSEGK